MTLGSQPFGATGRIALAELARPATSREAPPESVGAHAGSVNAPTLPSPASESGTVAFPNLDPTRATGSPAAAAA